MRRVERAERMGIVRKALLVGASLALAPQALAMEIDALFAKPQETPVRSAEDIVREAMSLRFPAPSMARITTRRTRTSGELEESSFLVLRREVDGSLRIVTESLAPASVEGTRVLQIEVDAGPPDVYAFVRSLNREPFETSFQLADPFLCTWHEGEARTATRPMLRPFEILSREMGAEAGEPVTRILVRDMGSSPYDRMELSIAQDGMILRYRYFLDAADASPDLVATLDRSDLVEIGGHMVPTRVSYRDFSTGDRIDVELEHMPIPSDLPQTLFSASAFHRPRISALAATAPAPANEMPDPEAEPEKMP